MANLIGVLNIQILELTVPFSNISISLFQIFEPKKSQIFDNRSSIVIR